MEVQWQVAMDELEAILQKTARVSGLITYGEVASHILSQPMGPHSPELAHLLCKMQVRDTESGSPLLTSLVVAQRTGRPGRGFFALAGAYFRIQDPEVFWLEEVALSHEAYGGSKNRSSRPTRSAESKRPVRNDQTVVPMADEKEFILSFFD